VQLALGPVWRANRGELIRKAGFRFYYRVGNNRAFVIARGYGPWCIGRRVNGAFHWSGESTARMRPSPR
jgi:hypothetical protein